MTPLERSSVSAPDSYLWGRLSGWGLSAALAMALLFWRADVVRLLPQTAAFYRMVGLEVNLRGVQFKDVKVSTETVEGKPVLVIEGVIVGQSRKPVMVVLIRYRLRPAQI